MCLCLNTVFRNWVGVILAARLIVKCGRQVWYTCAFMHYEPQIHCLGKRHVWLLLLCVCKRSMCSVLTCLHILAAQYSWVAHSVFLYLHRWHVIIFPPCLHRFECFDIHRHVSVCVELSQLSAACPLYKTQNLFLRLPRTFHPHLAACWHSLGD